MPIYCDPTELREGSPMANLGERKLLRSTPYLEFNTGADYLVTRNELPLSKVETLPEKLTLNLLCADGILVQRKSGNDLANSIPGLSSVLTRMKERCPRCYLAPVGYFDRGHDGNLTVNDMLTGWNFQAYIGALDSWTFHGGHVMTPFPENEEAFLDRLIRMEQRLKEAATEALALPEAVETLKAHPKAATIRTLMTFPGVGDKLAVEVAEWAPTLWEAMMAISHLITLKMPSKPKGLGKQTIADCRTHLGIPDDAYGIGLYVQPPKKSDE